MARPPTVPLLAGAAQNGESRKAIIACNDWLRLGPGRSLPVLLARYTGSVPTRTGPAAPVENPAETDQNRPPTDSLGTLKEWSAAYGWQDRAEEYDAVCEAVKDAVRATVMHEGLALDYERVLVLKETADLLVKQLYERGEDGTLHNLWVPDVKQIGEGPFAERVDIEHFNSALLAQLRGVLDDLAKETGGRIRRAEVTGKDGEPLFKLYQNIDVDRV